MTKTKHAVALLAFCCLLVSAVLAQDAVPVEILQRTRFIKAGNEAGTAFSIDYQGTLYLVTARHVIAGLPDTKAIIQISSSGEWKDYRTVRTPFPPSKDVDIAVLETDAKVAHPYEVLNTGKGEGPTFGQNIWFLGYPWGIHTHLANFDLPFIKRGTLSAIDATDPKAAVLYIDGFNNPGFSGGPILYWEFKQHAYRVLGVVQGYKADRAQVLINGERVDTDLLVNSGILVGYNIQYAIDAIEQGKRQGQ